MGEQLFPRGRERHAARLAHEQTDPELLLEGVNLPRERGLGNAQTPRGTGDISFFGDGYEALELSKTHPFVLAWISPCRRRSGDTYPVLVGAVAPRHEANVSIEILSRSEIQKMRIAGRAAAETLARVKERLVPGTSTAAIDAFVREETARRGGKPSQLGYDGFPATVCTSVNEVVCHGIPRSDVILRDGDIVNVDVTTELGGFHGDTSATFFVGAPSALASKIVRVAKACREAGISVIREGARLGDIGAAIEELAQSEGCSVVRDFGGHGIGRKMHMAPHVSHVGTRGMGPRLRAGMALTVEPMVNLGGADVVVLADGWTVVTRDGSLSAQFEHTIVVTRDGCEIMTALDAEAPLTDRERVIL